MKVFKVFAISAIALMLSSGAYKAGAAIIDTESSVTSSASFSVFGTDWRGVFKSVFSTPTKTYSDGSILYIGEIDESGNVSGQGAVMYDDASTYWGDFDSNQYSGTGLYIIGNPDDYRVANCPEAKYYVGGFEKGVKSGYGTCYDINGKLIYYGLFENDRPTETYPYTTGDMVDIYSWGNIDYGEGAYYVGELKEGEIHGRGIFITGKAPYTAWYGFFYEGEPWGEGIWFKNDGTCLISDFESDVVEAALTASESTSVMTPEIIAYLDRAVSNPTFSEYGGKYVGNVSSTGVAEGLGMYVFDGGDYVLGEFKDNARNGTCIYLIADEDNYFLNCPGSRYFVGNYSNNKREGTGTLYDGEGKLIYYGDFSNGKPTGTYPSTGYDKYRFEVIRYDGGDIYFGETENGRPVGRGIYIYVENDLGIWYSRYLNGKAYGKGIYIRWDGTIRNGEFLESGTFVETDPPTGSTVSGNSKPLYEDPLYNKAFELMFSAGFRVMSNSGDKYKGMFGDSGRMTGLGCYRWSSGSTYFGYQYENDCEDYGIYLVSEEYYIANCDKGAFYVGEYENDYRNGMGTIYDEYGNLLYYGEFKDGQPLDVYPSTEEYLKEWKFAVKDFGNYIYIGELHNGNREGKGFIVFKNNGDAWYGSWDEDHRSGEGVYIYTDGSTDYGSWDTDNFTRY